MWSQEVLAPPTTHLTHELTVDMPGRDFCDAVAWGGWFSSCSQPGGSGSGGGTTLKSFDLYPCRNLMGSRVALIVSRLDVLELMTESGPDVRASPVRFGVFTFMGVLPLPLFFALVGLEGRGGGMQKVSGV